MSAASLAPPGSGTPAAPHARTTHVLLALMALALLGGALWRIARPRGGSLDPQAAFEARFEPRELPLDLVPVQAEQLVRGDVVLRLEREVLEPEPERQASPPGATGDSPTPPLDWSKVQWGEPGAPPREVVIVDLPLENAKAELERLIRGGMDFGGDWKQLPEEGCKRILRRDLLAWGELECAAVHEREFEPGGTFRDVVRVNLSRAGEPRVLAARFGRGVAGLFEPVRVLLAALQAREQPQRGATSSHASKP